MCIDEKRLNWRCATFIQCCLIAGHWHCINVEEHWKSDFRFCFIFNIFDIKHTQFLINKGFSDFCRNDIEADSLTLFLPLFCWHWTGYCSPSYRFLYVKSLVFYGSIIFFSRSYTCHIRLFLPFESNSLSVTAVQERGVKGSLSKIQDLSNSVFSKTQVLLYCELVYIYIGFMVKNLFKQTLSHIFGF